MDRPVYPRSPAPTTYKEYAKEKVPSFDGSIRDYPQFKQEWVSCVQPGRDEKWSIITLNKNTPKAIDLRNVESLTEAWQQLDAKYGNPVNVSATLIKEFLDFNAKAKSEASKIIELKNEVMKLYNNLKAIKEENQIVANTYILNQVIYKMPRRYQEAFSLVKEEKLVPESSATLWSITSDYLKSQATRLERDLPWLLDSNSKAESKSPNGPPQHSGTRQHVNAVKAKNFEEQKARHGPCIHCSEHYTIIGQGNVENISTNLKSCNKFTALSPTDRAEIVRSNKACAYCLDWRHETCLPETIETLQKKEPGQSGVQIATPPLTPRHDDRLRQQPKVDRPRV